MGSEGSSYCDLGICFLLVFGSGHVHGNGIFRVQRKFGGDAHRNGRVLGAVDLPLYGNGSPSDAGLYFAQIEVGTPPKRFNAQVDTAGSDILWINCEGCKQCPTESDLNIELMFYDPDGSKSASSITCDQPFCTSAYEGTLLNCTTGVLCPYHVPYGDGSTTSGYNLCSLLIR